MKSMKYPVSADLRSPSSKCPACRAAFCLPAVLWVLSACSSSAPTELKGTFEKLDEASHRTGSTERRPISDTHPYQINDYLIYPVRWNKVEELAPTVQELLQARYGPGVVVVPHIASNKLLIYLPPPQEQEKAGGTGLRSSLRAPGATSGARSRGRGTTRTLTR